MIMNFRDSTLKKTTLDIFLDFHLGGRVRPSESQPKSLSSWERMMCLCFAWFLPLMLAHAERPLLS